jgi:lipoprotein-anchoring transpeptidase ErfK/SrfK
MSGTRLFRHMISAASLAAAVVTGLDATTGTQVVPTYRIDPGHSAVEVLKARYDDEQLAVLEKLNRADRAHLARLSRLVVPIIWRTDELDYSPLPKRYEPGIQWPTYVVVHLPGQVFGAYAYGTLVRWGPVSSGARTSQTPSGLFTLNWRSPGRASTIDQDWFMRWYFNFGNREGLAFHAYALPGSPASHGCIRLLERDAQWLYEWGVPWTLDTTGTRVLQPGTPVFVVGRYDFDVLPPWQSLTWLTRVMELPAPSAPAASR